MRSTLRNKNLIITPALTAYIEAKVLKPLRKLLGNLLKSELPILDLEVGRSTKHHNKGKVYRVTASLTFGKNVLRAEVENEDVRVACDLLKEELERSIGNFKEKFRAKNFRQARKFKKDLRFSREARFFRKGRIRNEGN